MKTNLVILGSLFLFFTAVLPIHAKTAEQWYEQAFEQSLNSQYIKAIQSYRQALRLKKDWAKAHHGLAVMYFKLKDGVKAAHHLRLAKKFYPEADKFIPSIKLDPFTRTIIQNTVKVKATKLICNNSLLIKLYCYITILYFSIY